MKTNEKVWVYVCSDPGFPGFFRWIHINELRDILGKNDSRQDSYEIVRPSTVEQAAPAKRLGPPNTPQELDSLLSSIDRHRLGKLVGQLLVESSVNLQQSQSLLLHLDSLVQASDKLRRYLKPVLESKQNQADVAKAG